MVGLPLVLFRSVEPAWKRKNNFDLQYDRFLDTEKHMQRILSHFVLDPQTYTVYL